MLDIPEHPLTDPLDQAEQTLEKLDLTAAAVRLGIGVDGVRRRLQRGSLHGLKEDGKWFVLLPAEQELNGVQHDAEHPDRSAEQELDVAEQRLVDLLEAQNERLWKELEERRREVSELHILLRREQERNERIALPAPIDYVATVQQSQNRVEQALNRERKGFWKRFFDTT